MLNYTRELSSSQVNSSQKGSSSLHAQASLFTPKELILSLEQNNPQIGKLYVRGGYPKFAGEITLNNFVLGCSV